MAKVIKTKIVPVVSKPGSKVHVLKSIAQSQDSATIMVALSIAVSLYVLFMSRLILGFFLGLQFTS